MSYLDQYDAIPANQPGAQVALVSGWLQTDWRPFFEELRDHRPILVTPAFMLVTLYSDIVEVHSRPHLYSVRPYTRSMDPPEVMKAALQADQDNDDAGFEALVFEALRFNPINPLVFRFCEQASTVAGGSSHATQLPQGSIVFACTASAMFDPAAFPEPDTFDATRSKDLYLHYGSGDHTCLGQLVATVMISEAVKRILRRPGVRLLPGAAGQIDFQGGPFPEKFVIAYDRTIAK